LKARLSVFGAWRFRFDFRKWSILTQVFGFHGVHVFFFTREFMASFELYMSGHMAI